MDPGGKPRTTSPFPTPGKASPLTTADVKINEVLGAVARHSLGTGLEANMNAGLSHS